jgi:hypothetical protein
MLRHEALEVTRDLPVAPQGQSGFGEVFEAREPQLFEAPDLDLRELLVEQVGQDRPAPEAERLD